MSDQPDLTPESKAPTTLEIYQAAIALLPKSGAAGFTVFIAIIIIMVSFILLGAVPVASNGTGSSAQIVFAGNVYQAAGFILITIMTVVFTLQTLLVDLYWRQTGVQANFGQAIVSGLRRYLPALVLTVALGLSAYILVAIISLILGLLDQFLGPTKTVGMIAGVLFGLLVAPIIFGISTITQFMLFSGLLDVTFASSSPPRALLAAWRRVTAKANFVTCLRFAMANFILTAVPIFVVTIVFDALTMILHTDIAKFLLSLLMLVIFIGIYLIVIAAQMIFADSLRDVRPVRDISS